METSRESRIGNHGSRALHQVFFFSTVFLGFLFCLGLTGCGDFREEFGKRSFWDQLTKPRPWGLSDTPEGSPEFQQGWNDGCETGLAVYGNDRYKSAYGFKQDLNLINNPEYYRAWKDAYTHCRWYVFNWSRSWQQ